MPTSTYNTDNICEILPMSEVQRAVFELLMKAPPDIKHRVRSSTQGIMKAWGLKDLDKNMACFRAITAQEEAESAIIHSLKRRNYSNAKKLRPYDHTHKTSVFYIVSAFTELFPMLKGFVEASFTIEHDDELGKIAPKIRFKLVGSKDERAFYPIPPLNFQINSGEGEDKVLHNFEVEIKKLTSRKGHDNFLKYLKEDANIRNEILYASNQGVPHVSMNVEKFIRAKAKYVYVLHLVCLLIDFYREKQLLVQQLLDILIEGS